MEGKTQETAAAKAGMSVRSARKWQCGLLPSQAKPEHRWRTRPDPFDGVWEDEIEPLLRNDPTGKLKATPIIARRTNVLSCPVFDAMKAPANLEAKAPASLAAGVGPGGGQARALAADRHGRAALSRCVGQQQR